MGIAAVLYVMGGRWRTTGWFPKSLYLGGGVLLLLFFLDHRSALFVLGASAIALSRIVPAHGWKRQPGEG